MATANVLRTIFTYPLAGVGPYTIAFDYLARKFVQVTLIGVDRKVLTLGTDYRFTDSKHVQLQATVVLTGYQTIEIRRFTDAQDRLVDFQDGSILRASDLNVSQVQTMHIAEEGRDVAGNTLGVDTEGNLDARNRKMVNLVDGVADGDAVTMRQTKAWGGSALNQADRAQTEANRAEVARKGAEDARDAANLSKGAAAKSEQNAATSAQNASQAANSALQQATAANGSANRASASENASATNATNADTSAKAAADSAADAATEAAKLGNMNNFASLIGETDKTVDNEHITWDADVITRKNFPAAIALMASKALKAIVSVAGVQKAAMALNLLKDTASDPTVPVKAHLVVKDNETDTAADFVFGNNGGLTVPGLVNHGGLRRIFTQGGYTWRHNVGSNTTNGDFYLQITRADAASEVVLNQITMHQGGAADFSGSTFINGSTTAYATVTTKPPSGAFLNAAACRSQLRGRGANGDPLGAYCGMYIQEQVGTTHRIILNLNGYQRDTNWQFNADGSINTNTGFVLTQGSDVRIKSDIVPAKEGAGERLDQLGLVEYTEISTGRRRRGWIAQQADTVDSLYTFSGDAKSTVEGEEITILNTDDRAMIADLIAEVQSLRSRVKELELK
ncbi:MAG: hypothetical protein EOM68_00055 [Spirochaetia bacterium]|nr:hypothetical protein [Spirochaetia bacterium]